MATTMFRPCIDLHEGKVKQIVGGTLNDSGAIENFVSEKSPSWYAQRFAKDKLRGGHVIKLGPGNDQAAREEERRLPRAGAENGADVAAKLAGVPGGVPRRRA